MRARIIVGFLICLGCSSLFADKVSPDDVLYSVTPRYPRILQSERIGGTGRFRMMVDFKTGKVTDVLILKTTGSDVLDREAILALRRWRFKPGKARQVDLPITFHDGKEPLVLPPGSTLAPHR
ncbi:MAG TPA: energy transducer TonB [Chthoniobacterales bacterium]|nr:energy transducer TonB [Chthoniobacterales bacterium]